MSWWKINRWIICVVFFVLLAGSAQASQKVTVITGIGKVNTKRIGTIQPVFDGIREVLLRRGIVPEFEYVELAGVDDAIKEGVGLSASALALRHNPDVVITLTDDALKYVGTRIDNTPVVFAYIYSNPMGLGLPKSNITGVTRSSHAVQIWKLARELTGADKVIMLSKNNEAMQGAKKALEANASGLRVASGVKLTAVHLVDRFRDWADVVKNCRTGMIYLADTSRVDRNGPMKDEDLVHWTVQNAHVPVIAAAEKDVKAGALLAVVADDKQVGINAARLAIRILDGARPSDIPYVTTTQGALVINKEAARKFDVQIPRAVLSSAMKIYE